MIGRRRAEFGALLAAALVALALPSSVQGPGALAAPPSAGQRPVAPLHTTSTEVTSQAVARTVLTQLQVRLPAAAAPRGRLAVGDSLMVSVTSQMRRKGFQVHAKVGRQFSTAPGIVRGYAARLPRNVVIELGTNGTIRASDCRAVVRRAGKNRRVFLVTPRVPRSWQKANLRTLRACDRRYKASRVRIVDWYGYSAGHPNWFAADRVHLSASGQRAFARLIDRELDKHGLA